MSKAQYRGLSTPERVRAQETGSPTRSREVEESERPRSRSVWDTITVCFPHSVRLWIRQLVQDLSFSSSPHKYGLKTSDTPSRLGKLSDGGISGTLSTNSSATSSGSSPANQSFLSKFRFLFSCGKKSSSTSFLPYFLLCVITAFLLITISGTVRSVPRVVFPPHNYRRAQLLVWRELYHGGILGLGSVKPREVGSCPAGMEDYVPCYNVTANLEAGYTDGLEFERHCELSHRMLCSVSPPKDYKILLKWPGSREGIWRGNLQINTDTNQNRFLVEENRLKFLSKDPQLMDDVGSYAQRVASMMGLQNYTNFAEAGIRNVLDIGCGSGSFGDLLWSHDLATLCVAPYEEHGGQVQLTLERGIPGMIGSFVSTQLPYPSSSFDFIQCANCGINLHHRDGKPLIEIDRLLRPGGYFVWMISSLGMPGNDDNVWRNMKNMTSRLCWEILSERDSIVVWQKKGSCFGTLVQGVAPNLCEQGRYEADWSWQQPLRSCITLSPPIRRVSVQKQPVWPSRLQLAATDLTKSGPGKDEVTGEPRTWTSAISEYWSLLTPIIFSDHPRRLGDEDILPAASAVRNVMDLNAGYGAFNAALVMSGKAVWVMNVVPTSVSNTLPFIFDRGLVGTNHDWCEAFPTYPRTYDLLHAADLLSQELRRQHPCGLSHLFSEMDRMLRPEGWVFLRDEAELIEDARAVATQLRWESRMIEVSGDSEQRLLVCQKTFWKG